jgi:hypothetical protein
LRSKNITHILITAEFAVQFFNEERDGIKYLQLDIDDDP